MFAHEGCDMKGRAALGVLDVELFTLRGQLFDFGDVSTRGGVVKAGIDAKLPFARRRLRDGAADKARNHRHAGDGKDHLEEAPCHGWADRPKAGTLAQSSFTPDAFMIAPHFVVSSAMNAANPAASPRSVPRPAAPDSNSSPAISSPD